MLSNIMSPLNYRHDDHYGHDERLHQHADALLGHVWTGLVIRAIADVGHRHDENRAYARTLIKRAIAVFDSVSGTVETDNNVCLRFTLQRTGTRECVTFWVPWDQIKGDLRTAGHNLDI